MHARARALCVRTGVGISGNQPTMREQRTPPHRTTQTVCVAQRHACIRGARSTRRTQHAAHALSSRASLLQFLPFHADVHQFQKARRTASVAAWAKHNLRTDHGNKHEHTYVADGWLVQPSGWKSPIANRQSPIANCHSLVNDHTLPHPRTCTQTKTYAQRAWFHIIAAYRALRLLGVERKIFDRPARSRLTLAANKRRHDVVRGRCTVAHAVEARLGR